MHANHFAYNGAGFRQICYIFDISSIIMNCVYITKHQAVFETDKKEDEISRPQISGKYFISQEIRQSEYFCALRTSISQKITASD